jgi:hypothetical protein
MNEHFLAPKTSQTTGEPRLKPAVWKEMHEVPSGELVKSLWILIGEALARKRVRFRSGD